MRNVIMVVGIALLIAAPALAGERGGGPRGGHHPAPRPCCAHAGGGNVNVNINAGATASARAATYGSARSWSHGGGQVTRVYGGGYRSGGYGGGYWGGGGPVIGVPVYGYIDQGLDVRSTAGPSAPFGYAVHGFGRDYRDAPYVPTPVRESRYGHGHHEAPAYGESYYSESAYGMSSRESRSYEESTYSWSDRREDRGDDDRGRTCDCYDTGPVPYTSSAVPYESSTARDYYGDLPPPDYVAPEAPPPHHNYRQEPGERG